MEHPQASASRREFVTLLGGAAALSSGAWPSAARAQQPAVPVIGFLSSGSPRAFASLVAAFRQGVSEQGYVEGRNLFIAVRWAEGHYNELDGLANDLVRRQVRLIAATGGVVSAKAAMKATATIPILFVIGSDPVQLGLVASLARPGGNATGASVFSTELAPKRLELLNALGSEIRIAAILVNPGSVTTDIETRDAIAAAQLIGLQLLVLKASTESEIDAAFGLANQQQVSALLVSADPFFTSRRDQIVALAARHAIPVMYPWREYVQAGGLMSYGTELTWGYHLIGRYAGRILKGEKPSDLPVQLPTRFKLVVNLKTAEALGLELPMQLLALADEAIE
jgi:putative tryptophan/tyrosine transport system substrate-binding protein